MLNKKKSLNDIGLLSINRSISRQYKSCLLSTFYLVAPLFLELVILWLISFIRPLIKQKLLSINNQQWAPSACCINSMNSRTAVFLDLFLSVFWFRSCHLILFVSSTNSRQIVKRQCCLLTFKICILSQGTTPEQWLLSSGPTFLYFGWGWFMIISLVQID